MCFEVGHRLNSWTVISEPFVDKSKGYGRRVMCECDCGTVKDLDMSMLKRGNSKGCIECKDERVRGHKADGIEAPLRKCTSCGFEAWTEDELELMSPNKKLKYGRRNKCAECQSVENKRWAEENKERMIHKARTAGIKRKYGITREEYERCMATSDACEICGTTENLRYDHNHDTNEFRGVLCGNCNSGLGMLGDNPEIVKQALNYLLERGSYGNN